MQHTANRRRLPSSGVGRKIVLILAALPLALAARLLPSRAAVATPDPARDFSRGTTAARQLAITFDADDQSDPRPEVLDVLKSRGVRTTFFLTGRFIETHPDLVRRIVQEGHEAGNHSYDHPQLTMTGRNGQQVTLPTMTKARFQDELRKTARLFAETTGTRMAPFWRAPGGEQNEQLRTWAAELGYQHVGWTQDPETGEDFDSLDWVADKDSGRFFTPSQIRTRILSFGDTRRVGAKGAIALFHLSSARPPQEAVDHELGIIIDSFRSRGYQLVRVSDLYRATQGASGAAVAGREDASSEARTR